MGQVMYESTCLGGLFAGIHVHSTVLYKMLENTFMDFFYIKSTPKDAFEAFVKSLSWVPSTSSLTEYSDLTKAIAATLLTNFTSVL